ncbi:MAG: phage major capsid protein [Desulfobulbaceae bacterium]|nr:phage major capsid protein [Desulfobulbaceae bacterium]
MEQRQKVVFPAEIRAADDAEEGVLYAFFPTPSVAYLGDVIEIAAPGLMDDSIESGDNIFCFADHEPNHVLGNTRNGTLEIEHSPAGVSIRVRLDLSITYHRDLWKSVKRKDKTGLSMGFTVQDEKWERNKRILRKIKVYEFSFVTMPAYEQTQITARSGNNMSRINVSMSERHHAAYQNWLDNQPTNGDPPDPFIGGESRSFNSVEMPDAPIYRGPNALGQQMVDIAAMSRGEVVSHEARSRWEQMVKREETRAAGTGGHVMAVGSDGGFLLQGETAMDMITNGFGNSAVLKRAAMRDIGRSQFIELVGIDETSRATGSRGGGVRVYSDKELDALTQSKTKFDKIRLEPKRLTGFYYASNEILDNAPVLQSEMSELFHQEFAFKGQDLAIRGNGVGEAMGIMNAGCLVTVDKEAGQTDSTVVFENIVKMRSRLRVRNRKSVCWLANQDVEPQLFQLALPVGTGGSVVPVYRPVDGPNDGIDGYLMGTPIIFIEQCETLGTVGDLILADWSMYYAANRGGIESASSMHLKFDHAQVAFRFLTWMDGQPRIPSAITPYKGSNTVSPFVVLQTRG